MVTFLIIWLVGVYVSGALWHSCGDISKKKADIWNASIVMISSWLFVLILLVTMLISWSVPPIKRDLSWLWPGQWFYTERHIHLHGVYLLILSGFLLTTFGYAYPDLIVSVLSFGTSVLVASMANSIQEDGEPIIPRNRWTFSIVFTFWLLGLLAPATGKTQSVYLDYYSDPSHIQCSQVEICSLDTTLTADCFDEYCFNEQPWVPIQRYGPYLVGDNSIFYPHTGILVHYQSITELPTPGKPVDVLAGIPELVKLLQNQPPLELTIKGVSVMVEPSKAPEISVYFGEGPIYTFLLTEQQFEERPLKFHKIVHTLSVQDIVAALTDYFKPYE